VVIMENEKESKTKIPITLDEMFEQSWRKIKDYEDSQYKPFHSYLEETFNRTKEIVREIVALIGDKLPIPRIYPGSNGDIDFFWNTDTFVFLVTIAENVNEPIYYYGDNQLNSLVPLKVLKGKTNDANSLSEIIQEFM
jgi:hypothetical protein